MKELKTLDLGAQCLLVLAALFILAVEELMVSFYVFYFGLGAYQLITHYIKYFNGFRGRGRRIYNRTLNIIYIGGVISLFSTWLADGNNISELVVFFYALMMLWVGIAMAIFNIVLSFKELNTEVVVPQNIQANNQL